MHAAMYITRIRPTRRTQNKRSVVSVTYFLILVVFFTFIIVYRLLCVSPTMLSNAALVLERDAPRRGGTPTLYSSYSGTDSSSTSYTISCLLQQASQTNRSAVRNHILAAGVVWTPITTNYSYRPFFLATAVLPHAHSYAAQDGFASHK